MKGLIEVFEHTGEGISEVYDNGKWLLSIKNWREANSVEKIARLEIHYTTDQRQSLLVAGARGYGRYHQDSGFVAGGGEDIQSAS